MSINFSKFIENRIENIKASDSFAFAAAIGLGPWLCPLAPAIVFGYALYVSAPVNMAEFRTVTAVAVAIGLIVAGAVSSHNAIVAGGWGPWSLVVGYIGLEIIGLWLMSVSFDVKVVGTVASLLTLIVYLSRSNAKEIDMDRAEAKEVEQAKRKFQIEQVRLNADHQRRLAEQAAELKHTEKLARIEAKKMPATVKETVKESVKETVKPFTLDDLKAALEANGRPNLTQLAKNLHISRPTLYKRIDSLIDSGQVVKNGSGYEVTK
jgi:hypothetical protein